MNNELFPVVSTERNQQTKTKNKSDFLSSLKGLSTGALMSMFLLLPNESKAQEVKDLTATDTIKTEQVDPVAKTLGSVDKEKQFIATPEMFENSIDSFENQQTTSEGTPENLDGPDAIKDKVQNAINDSTNVELQIFKSALGSVSMGSDISGTTSLVEAKLGWNGTYRMTNWASFSSKGVVDFTIMGKDVIPLGLATAELIINPTENITVSGGYLTTPSTAGRMSPFTVLSGFENAGQRLMGPHTLGTGVKIDYAKKDNPKGLSASAGVFDINGSTEINASAKYKGVRLSGWKNSNDKQVGGSIGINVGKSSGTLTLDNGKFGGGADISLSPTVNIYGGFSGEKNQDNGEKKLSVSEIGGYKTLPAKGNTAMVAVGYNPNTKTLNMYLVMLLK